MVGRKFRFTIASARTVKPKKRGELRTSLSRLRPWRPLRIVALLCVPTDSSGRFHPTHFMQLSVIIPTRNRRASLKALLRSLEETRLGGSARLEICVVDNGSTDDTESMLDEEISIARRYPLFVVREERRGKARALNLGLEKVRGEFVVIFDDDVVVRPDCIAKHLEAYQHKGFAVIQGRVLPGKDPEGQGIDPSRAREYNIPIRDLGSEFREIRGVIGTNVSFRREVFEHVGLFDVRLGPGAAGFSEDSEFSIRLRRAGFKIGYTPHAIVYHELNPARYGRGYQRDTQFRKGLSRSIYRQDSVLFRVVPNLLVNCLRWSGYRLIGASQKAYKTEGRIWKCLGYIAGKYRHLSRGKIEIPD